MEKLRWAKPLQHGHQQLFQITAPFAPESINPYEACLEGYHGATLAYSSAMEVHQLTDQRDLTIHLVVPPGIHGYSLGYLRSKASKEDEPIIMQQLPIATAPEAWENNDVPRMVRLKTIADRSIDAHSVKDSHVFEFVEMAAMGTTVRVTSLERTLVDGLRHPDYCGNLNDVFRAWVEATDQLSLERLLNIVERFEIKILYQRVGFVLETLGYSHKRIDEWKTKHVQRGGSRVLHAGEPFASEFSETWGLSINHPIDILVDR